VVQGVFDPGTPSVPQGFRWAAPESPSHRSACARLTALTIPECDPCPEALLALRPPFSPHPFTPPRSGVWLPDALFCTLRAECLLLRNSKELHSFIMECEYENPLPLHGKQPRKAPLPVSFPVCWERDIPVGYRLLCKGGCPPPQGGGGGR